MKLRVTLLLLAMCAIDISCPAVAQDAPAGAAQVSADAAAEAEAEATDPVKPIIEPAEPLESNTITTIRSLISVRDELRADIQALRQESIAAQTLEEKQSFLEQIEKLNEELRTTLSSLQEIAAGTDIASLRAIEETKFDFQQELFALLEPAIAEMKDMTSDVRAKSELRERIGYYSSKLPNTERAIENLERLLIDVPEDASDADPGNAQVRATLEKMLRDWRKQDSRLRAELQSVTLLLDNLEASEQSLAEASEGYLKRFFQNRGKVLGQALLVILAIIFLGRLLQTVMRRLIPGYEKKRRTFRTRLVDLAERILTVFLVVAGPMFVFYRAEDWLLFSLAILLLIGIGLTLRQAIPRYWHQVQLFLNVGTVREGERLDIDGVPWMVDQINFYTMLQNPTAGLRRRVKIDDLVDLRSRPVQKSEPWFPCRMGDWVLLNDDKRGKVVGMSIELVELVQRGGARKFYTTGDFLSREPLNLSANFRVKETIGVSYSLQSEISSLPGLLRTSVEEQFDGSEFGKGLINLRVEVEKANDSSLDLVVIADFKGEEAPIYNRLRRAVQLYCIEACNQHGWEIPFTQMVVHRPEPEAHPETLGSL